MKKNLVELIGTMFLVLAICFTGDPIVIGLTLSLMVYAGAHISGSHYNPAVTLALLINKSIDLKGAISYWISQVLGAFLAALIYSLVDGSSFIPAPSADFVSSVVVEILGTFALCYVIFTVAVSEKAQGNSYFGFAIGLTITCVASMWGDISGGAFNPAVYLGPAIYKLFSGPDLSNIVLYLVGPLGGGILAAIVYKFLTCEKCCGGGCES